MSREPTKWNILSGNEIALLLADWVWTNYVRTNPTGDKSMTTSMRHLHAYHSSSLISMYVVDEYVGKCVMLASTVSSQVVGAMARKEGFQFIVTCDASPSMSSHLLELLFDDHNIDVIVISLISQP